MKKIIFLMGILLLGLSAFSQTQQKQTVVVNTEDLTVDQLAKIKADQELDAMMKKMETYGSWVGVGKEIGITIREGLTAVVDVAEKFGKTEVGKFTMVLIAWKVAGKDVVRIFLGLIFMVLISVLLFKSFKSYTTRRFCIKSPGWKFWGKKEYEIVTPTEFEGIQAVKILHLLLYAGAFGITYAIMFA